MEKLIDIFVRENPRRAGEEFKDYMCRYVEWLQSDHGWLSRDASRRIASEYKETIANYENGIQKILEEFDHTSPEIAVRRLKELCITAVAGLL